MVKAKSYAERLFDLPEIGPLSAADAEEAIVRPPNTKELRSKTRPFSAS
jgi:hypothetical protein